MAQFCFYNINDINQEAVGVCDAPTIEEATRYFALHKMLTEEQFTTIFGIKQYTYGEATNTNTRKQLLKG